MKKVSIILSIAAVVLSLVAIYVVCSSELKNESASYVIGGLSALATFLVGWQIFTLIDLRQYEYRLRRLEEDYATKYRELSEFVKTVQWMSLDGVAEAYRHLAKVDEMPNDELQVHHYIWKAHALSVACQTEKQKYVQKEISKMCPTLTLTDNILKNAHDHQDQDARKLLIQALAGLKARYLQFFGADVYSETIDKCLYRLLE